MTQEKYNNAKTNKMGINELPLSTLADEQRHYFVGTFERLGYKSNNKAINPSLSPILFLKNIRFVDNNHNLLDLENSPLVIQHILLNYGKQFLKLGKLHTGDKLLFKARVCKYTKRFNPVTIVNYKLERPSKIKKLDNSYYGNLPLNNKNAVVGYIMYENRKLYASKKNYNDNLYTSSYREWLKNNNYNNKGV